jgi:2-keto-4-pentenoate hydratase/2-oxohepta-3-ene-1,7-dioic acid hydratase in catechol pathway
VPIYFTKVPESVIGPGEPILIVPEVSTAIDYEAELTVVIGRGGKGIKAADAMKHVWGYTIINDVTARDWQGRHSQWVLGKSFDTFCPMGPWLVSADECDGTNTGVRCYVNGEKRQDARTTDLIFDIPTLIETLSAGITLYPGDVIATGTPVGVGIGFKPPRYLKPGDLVRVEIDGIGALQNPVR